VAEGLTWWLGWRSRRRTFRRGRERSSELGRGAAKAGARHGEARWDPAWPRTVQAGLGRSRELQRGRDRDWGQQRWLGMGDESELDNGEGEGRCNTPGVTVTKI
jgi:hypothetical protein